MNDKELIHEQYKKVLVEADEELGYNYGMKKMSNENIDEDQRYEVFEGSEEDLIYIEDLDSQYSRLQQRIMDGSKCTLKHIAFAEDLGEMGMSTTDMGDLDIYLFDEPTDFTQPAFILS
jgi:hypothetical protein